MRLVALILEYVSVLSGLIAWAWNRDFSNTLVCDSNTTDRLPTNDSLASIEVEFPLADRRGKELMLWL